jgi:branched-chain amino acid transport system substrate-binding protein
MNASKKLLAAAIVATLAGVGQLAHADINIGVIASYTGPGAALGTDIKRTVALMPTSIDGEKINYLLLDDATDPSTAVKDMRKLTSEDKVDVVIGSNAVPNSAAMAVVADETKTPQIVIAPYLPPKDKLAWVFQSPQGAGLMMQRIAEDMAEHKIKNIGFIGFADGWGDMALKEMQNAAGPLGIKIVAEERYKRPDTSVTAQVLKILAAKPDAVFIGASGAPAALPQIELRSRGYTGKIYQTHGVTTNDFLRIGGKSVEGALIPVGPVLVADQLPDSMVSKKVGVNFNAAYEKMYGSRSTFAGSTWDAWLLIQNAIPGALKIAKPGTPEFRKALRDNLERTKDLVGVNGVYNMTANDHNGLDKRGRVLIEVANGQWKYVK